MITGRRVPSHPPSCSLIEVSGRGRRTPSAGDLGFRAETSCEKPGNKPGRHAPCQQTSRLHCQKAPSPSAETKSRAETAKGAAPFGVMTKLFGASNRHGTNQRLQSP